MIVLNFATYQNTFKGRDIVPLEFLDFQSKALGSKI
jgi:hypothetical protein